MDDKRFDDIIKQKAEAFTDTGHDAHALSDFRRLMINTPQRASGFSLGKTGYVVGALALFTLMNFGIVWYFSEGRYQALNQEIGRLESENNQLQQAGEEQSLSMNKPDKIQVDTVYVYRNLLVPSGNNVSEEGTKASSGQPTFKGGYDPSDVLVRRKELLDGDEQLSQELQEFLAENNLLLKDNDGNLMLLVNSVPVIPVTNLSMDNNSQSAAIRSPKYLSEVATYQQPQTRRKAEKKKISDRMLWALEKHNHSGVDFQFGVEGVYHKSNFDVGEGERNGGAGFMTEVLFSPAWRLETGIHFGARAYKISEDEINELPDSFFQDYPGYNDQLGELSTLESDALLIKVPLNLKRFAPLDHNKRWYVSAGLTPQWTRKQEFDYKYSVKLEPPDDEFVSFVGSKQEVGGQYYTTTVNLGLGTEIYLDQRLRWQLGLFFQKGIGDAGYENRKLVNSYGIKSSLWFNAP